MVLPSPFSFMPMTLIQQVERILRDNPFAREDDVYLIYEWVSKYAKEGVHITVHDYLKGVRDGNLPTWSAISRGRRKLQQEHPELRGSNYQARQQEAQKQRLAYAGV